MLSEDELKRALRRVPLIGADGPFHRFVDLWFVHQNLAGGKKTEVLAGLGAKMLGGRFTPRGTFETLYVATTAATARIEAESRITAAGVVVAPSKPCQLGCLIRGVKTGIRLHSNTIRYLGNAQIKFLL